MQSGSTVGLLTRSVEKAGYGVLLLLAVSCTISCRKGELSRASSAVSVQIDGRELLELDIVESHWNISTKVADISVEGAAGDRIQLFLPDLRDTGICPNLSIGNIHFSDGADFTSDKLGGGNIHISSMNSTSVAGDFHAILSDTEHGTETRTVTGTFTISGQ